MTTEVEIRGPLTENEYTNLLAFLKMKGKLLKEADQLAIFFHVKKDNLSLKKDHALEKLVLKIGGWHRGNRKEVEVILAKNQFDNALALLKGLGYTLGHKVTAFRQDFSYKGVQISLKTKAVIGPHYEMETIVSRRDQIAHVKKGLLLVAKELRLQVWTEKAYREHTRRMWDAYHPGPQRL
ncbi:MAG: CYTH domain-containing protein [Patescibacteria group bacterium]|mgnify:FL=1